MRYYQVRIGDKNERIQAGNMAVAVHRAIDVLGLRNSEILEIRAVEVPKLLVGELPGSYYLTKEEQSYADELRERYRRRLGASGRVQEERFFKDAMVEKFPRLDPRVVWFRYQEEDKDARPTSQEP